MAALKKNLRRQVERDETVCMNMVYLVRGRAKK